MGITKIVDGIKMPLTPEEQADYDAREAAWPAIQAQLEAKAALPDLATQVAHLTAAIVKSGVALPDDVITAANVKLEAIDAPAIELSIQALKR